MPREAFNIVGCTRKTLFIPLYSMTSMYIFTLLLEAGRSGISPRVECLWVLLWVPTHRQPVAVFTQVILKFFQAYLNDQDNDRTILKAFSKDGRA